MPLALVAEPDYSQQYGLTSAMTYYWDVGTLAWVKGTQVTGGGGGAVTIANGDDVAEGATSDAAVVTDTTGTVSGKLRGLVKWAFERMPAALGQGTMAQSLPVALASNQSALAVTGTFWQATQPVSGTVTAAGANTIGSSGALGALNDAVSVNLVGQNSASFTMQAGTLAATLTIEASNNGTDWTLATAQDLLTGSKINTKVFTNPNVIQHFSFVLSGGLTAVRVRVSSYTSGTANAQCFASANGDGLALLSPFNVGLSGQASPIFTAQVGGSDGTLTRSVRMANAWPAGTEYALITRNIPTKVAYTASAPAAASVGVASAQAVAANASRKGLVLVNTSANRISLGFGATAVLDSGVTLMAAGGTFIMDEDTFHAGAVNAIASGATSNMAIQEYT